MHINFLRSTPTLDPKRRDEKSVYQLYWTEPAAIKAYAQLLLSRYQDSYKLALDLGCNDGRWLELFRREGITIDTSYGVDIRPVERCYCDIFSQIDVVETEFEPIFNLVVSNPPFGNELHKFIQKAFEAVDRQNGLISFFVPITQLATGRNKRLIWDKYPFTRMVTYSTRPHCERNKQGKPSSYPGREIVQFEWYFQDGFLQNATDYDMPVAEWITYERDGRLEEID